MIAHDQHVEPYWFFTALRETTGKPAVDELRDWLESQWDDEKKRNYYHNSSVGPYQLQLLSHEYIKQLAARRAVWCWVEGEDEPGESAAMWSIYAHAGVAVQTTWNALASALPETRRFCAARIRYAEQDPMSQYALLAEGDDEPWVFRPHFVKLRSYRHENEIRVGTRCHPAQKGVLVRNIDPKRLIQSIIISPTFPYHEAASIKSMLEKQFTGSDIRVRHSSLLGTIREEEEFTDSIKESVRKEVGR